jgi:hypothetical protein
VCAGKSIPILMQKVDFRVYPEGGCIIYGVPNRVYFEALSPAGEPLDIEAELLAKPTSGLSTNDVESWQPVTTFFTEHEGRGRFSFTPDRHGEGAYQIRITSPASLRSQVIHLPAADLGATVKATKDTYSHNEPIEVSVHINFGVAPSPVPPVAPASAPSFGSWIGQLLHGKAGLVTDRVPKAEVIKYRVELSKREHLLQQHNLTLTTIDEQVHTFCSFVFPLCSDMMCVPTSPQSFSENVVFDKLPRDVSGVLRATVSYYLGQAPTRDACPMGSCTASLEEGTCLCSLFFLGISLLIHCFLLLVLQCGFRWRNDYCFANLLLK